MSQKLTLKKIFQHNFDDFILLIEKLAEYEHLEKPDEQAKERLKKDGLGNHPKYEAVLGYLDKRPIGYLIYFMTYSSFLALPTLFIEDIFILENFRRLGFGQQFFDFCIKLARQRGCGRMEWCVLTWNEPAIKFYEKNKAQKLDWYFYRYDKDQIYNTAND